MKLKPDTIVPSAEEDAAITAAALADPDCPPLTDAEWKLAKAADSFIHARQNANRDCPKCHGTGMYQYDHNHITICNLCCRHDRGWWQLAEHYGANNGKWCCRAGCGKVLDAPPEPACICTRCLDESGATVEFMGRQIPVANTRMVLCAICGNKRCPHARDHRHACTNSNEPGQPGSNYEDQQP